MVRQSGCESVVENQLNLIFLQELSSPYKKHIYTFVGMLYA